MGDSELQPLQDALSKSLVELTRTTAQLAAEDLGYFRVSYPKEAKQLSKSSSKILQLSRKLLQNAAPEATTGIPSYSSVDNLEDSWPAIVEVIDNLLEKADVTLDEFTGVIKRQELESEASHRVEEHRAPYTKRSTIPKPQLLFKNPPRNHPTGAFRPLLRAKPHAVVPLSQSLGTSPAAEGQEQHTHPYQEEIREYQYPASVRTQREPVPFTSFSDTKAIFVDTPEAVKEMLGELKQASEIAVDLEHHDKHSYIGVVSLMQISTRDKDWIVDTLQPWREDLQVLNEVFVDPSILKVFHGSTMDIIWLQRDLGLYVVGLFDTYHACKALQYPGRSLAFLLDKFANVKAQKQYQTADWRIRPLPTELMDYARSDTHYLLYIYDNLRNELIDQSQRLAPEESSINYVLEGSKKECLQKFEYFHYDEVSGTGRDGWYNLLIRTPALFTRQQFSVFRAVHQWRDQVARDEDESINYVMQKHILFDIARHVPTTPKDLYSVAVPMSDLLRGRVDELLAVIRKAIKKGESGPDMKTFLDEHPETIAYQARKAERARARKLPSQGGFAVGDIVRREREAADADQVPLGDIQTQTSSFWGSTIGSSRNHSTTDEAALPCLEVPLPPQLTGVDAVGTNLLPTEPDLKLGTPSTGENEAGESKDPSQGGSQKRKSDAIRDSNSTKTVNGHSTDPLRADAAQASDPMLSDVVALEDEETERAAKRARRAARKADKARRQAEQAAAQQSERPFDYASAPSVLHAKPTKPESGGVNPYAKATDTSKGARKVKGEMEHNTRSMTYKR